MRITLLLVAACGGAPATPDRPAVIGTAGGMMDGTGLYQSCDAPLELRFPPGSKLTLGVENGKSALGGGADKLVALALYWQTEKPQTPATLDALMIEFLDAGTFTHPDIGDRVVDGAALARGTHANVATGRGAMTVASQPPWLISVLVIAQTDSPRVAEVDAMMASLRLAVGHCD